MYWHVQRRGDDILALCQYRPLKLLDVFERNAGNGCDILRGHSGTDVRLDFAGGELAPGARVWNALAQFRLEHFVDGYAVSSAVFRRDKECAVLHSDDSQVLHADRLSGCHDSRLGCHGFRYLAGNNVGVP